MFGGEYQKTQVRCGNSTAFRKRISEPHALLINKLSGVATLHAPDYCQRGTEKERGKERGAEKKRKGERTTHRAKTG